MATLRAPLRVDFVNVGAAVIKVTHRCNLDCAYCYEHIGRGADMTIETFRKMVDAWIPTTTSTRLKFIFHGGEPTLLDTRWYVEAIHYARMRSREYGKSPVFAVQSNVINLSEDLIDLFSDLDVHVSASLDGPFGLDKAMRGRFDRALKTFHRLKEKNVRVAVLMTINHANWRYFKELCRWSLLELGRRNFKANPVYSVGVGSKLPDLDASAIFTAQSDITDYIIETEAWGAVEENVAIMICRFLGDSNHEKRGPSLCRQKRCGAGDKVVGITTDGNILPCGRFEWDDPRFFLGNIDYNPGEDAYRGRVAEFQKLRPENWLRCSECEARDVCSYGCQAFIVRSPSQINIECIPTKMLYQHFKINRQLLEPLAGRIRQRSNGA